MKLLILVIAILAAACGDVTSHGGPHPGSDCSTDSCQCPPGMPCAHTCSQGGAACDVQCADGEACNVTCDLQESCVVECAGTASCDVDCRDGLDCRVNCPATGCTVRNCEAGTCAVSCADGRSPTRTETSAACE